MKAKLKRYIHIAKIYIRIKQKKLKYAKYLIYGNNELKESQQH